MKTLTIAAVLLLVGCTIPRQAEQPELRNADAAVQKQLRAETERYLPTCKTDAECAELWEATKQWALAHPRQARVRLFKPDHLRVIFTGETFITMDIKLEPMAGGVRFLNTKIGCFRPDMIFAMPCKNEPDTLRLDFHKALHTAYVASQ